MRSTFENATYAKVSWRLIPLLFVSYIVAYLDRVNVGFAKIEMLADLHFSETVYGLGAGIFFVGYFLFEVPSNVILHRMGARRWIARIMLTWGVLSGAMMCVTTPLSFYVLRFLLGVAEAGFFPGVILYLTYWYPAERRARINALFISAIPLSGLIGGPVSGWIMQSSHGSHGLSGWQWIFILEAVPSIILGIVILFYLDDRIQNARWLSIPEKALLEKNIAHDAHQKQGNAGGLFFFNARVWLAALLYFCLVSGLYGISFWLPSIIAATGVREPLHIGLLSAVPYAPAMVVMYFVSHSADIHRERRWHLAIPAIAGGLGLLLSTVYSHNTTFALAALTLGTVGIMATLPLFWSLPTAFLGGTAAAAGIAFVNSMGNLSGFASPYLLGWIKQATQSTNIGMYYLAGLLFAAAALTFLFPSTLVNK